MLAALVLAVACGAAATPTEQPTEQPREPVLSRDFALQLVVSHVQPGMACVGDEVQKAQQLSLDAVYHETGIWMVTVGFCAFVVDDATGKVTGP